MTDYDSDIAALTFLRNLLGAVLVLALVVGLAPVAVKGVANVAHEVRTKQ